MQQTSYPPRRASPDVTTSWCISFAKSWRTPKEWVEVHPTTLEPVAPSPTVTTDPEIGTYSSTTSRISERISQSLLDVRLKKLNEPIRSFAVPFLIYRVWTMIFLTIFIVGVLFLFFKFQRSFNSDSDTESSYVFLLLPLSMLIFTLSVTSWMSSRQRRFVTLIQAYLDQFSLEDSNRGVTWTLRRLSSRGLVDSFSFVINATLTNPNPELAGYDLPIVPLPVYEPPAPKYTDDPYTGRV
ncbi:hypothetical protein BJ742DRAFT_783096, partial [Cladochytrium replicatum]